MFWDKWIPDKFLTKSEVCAVECCFEEQSTSYHITHLKQKNKRLELVRVVSVASPQDFPGYISKKKIPVVLILNGKGIVLKKINQADPSANSAEQLVASHFPALNNDHFCVQLYRQNDDTAFIALCRRELLEYTHQEIKKTGVDVAAIFLGAPALAGLRPIWSGFSVFQTSSQRIELSNNSIDVISNIVPGNGQETVNFEDIVLAPNYILSFAAGLSYLSRASLKEDLAEDLRQIELRHFEKNKFRFLLVCSIGIAFTLSVVNLFVYTHYFDKNAKLESELSVYQEKYDELNKLLSDYQKNKNLIESAGAFSQNGLSEYADRLGASLPDNIVLSDLHFNPKKINDNGSDSLITFDSKSVIIRGNCDKSMLINEWVNVLKTQKFVKDISLEKFTYNSSGFQPNFEIKLLTQNHVR